MTIRVVDNWGILTVQKGALLSGDWKRITVTAPEKNSDKIIEGDGWMLELAANYRLEKDATTGNYKLSKN
jgi:hypothetical protein